MPYINKQNRPLLDGLIDGLVAIAVDDSGTYNYMITTLIYKWINRERFSLYASGQQISGYKEYNDAIGVLECVKQELYRRVVAPYEDIKCKENGDVYQTRNQEKT